MNQLAERNERLAMDSVGMSDTGTGAKIAPQNLAEVVKFAEVMARADIALPKHLRGNAGACMAVSLQALDWQMNPFAVASKSYTVNGAIAYEAQLIAAVVNTRSGIKGRLKYAFEGEGGEMTCTVTGTLDDEECIYRSPPIGSITTKNSPLWKSDPQQQLGYFAARSWARRHCPEVILGVYDRDEAEEFRGPDGARDVTPKPSVMQRLREQAGKATQEPASEREGFIASTVQQEPSLVLDGDIMDEEHDAETGELLPPTPDAPTSGDGDSAPETGASPEEPAGDISAPAGSEPEFEPIPNGELPAIRRFARIAFRTAGTPNMSSETLTKVMNREINAGLTDVKSESGKAAVNLIRKNAKAVLNGDADFTAAVKHHAEGLGCEPEELIGDTDG